MLYNDNETKPTLKGTLLFWCEFLGFALMATAALKFLVIGGSTVHYEVHVDDNRSYETRTENRCWALCRPGSTNSEDRELEKAK